MLELAESTGGRAFYNTNDIKGSIRKAVEDAEVTYVLGFYPTHEKWDGKYRDLKVSTKRPGVRLRYRRGYYASTDPPFDVDQRKAALREAAFAPLEAGNVGMTAKLTPVLAAGERTAVVHLRLDARDIQMDRRENVWRGIVDLYILQRSSTGEALAYWHHTIQLEFSDETRNEFIASGFEVTKHLPLDPQSTELRIVARDNKTSALGSLIVPLSSNLFGGSSKP
jgi:hypothetical protein